MHSYLERVADHEGHCVNREFAELPHICPVCGRTGQPYRLAARSTNADDTAVDFALQCPRPSCRRVYVARYRLGAEGAYELDTEPWRRQAAPTSRT